MDTADLAERIAAIERDLEAGTYRPGPWKALIDEVRSRPVAERRAVADDLDRVSHHLHRRHQQVVAPLWMGLGAEAAAVAVGYLCLNEALEHHSNLLALCALGLWVTAFEPLVKMAVGSILGIRYSYAYLWSVEPRFKMRFGTYLATPLSSRVALHVAGCVGSPLGACLVGRAVRPTLPHAAAVCDAVFWAVNGINLAFFAAGLLGLKKVGKVPVSASSAGSAAQELRGT